MVGKREIGKGIRKEDGRREGGKREGVRKEEGKERIREGGEGGLMEEE